MDEAGSSTNIIYNKVSGILVWAIIVDIIEAFDFFSANLYELFLGGIVLIFSNALYFKVDSQGVFFIMRFEDLIVQSDGFLPGCSFLEFLLDLGAGGKLFFEFVFELIP